VDRNAALLRSDNTAADSPDRAGPWSEAVPHRTGDPRFAPARIDYSWECVPDVRVDLVAQVAARARAHAHVHSAGSAPPVRSVAADSRGRVTGVVRVEKGGSGRGFRIVTGRVRERLRLTRCVERCLGGLDTFNPWV